MMPVAPMRWQRVLGLDHLTLLDIAPPDFVALAAGAGFDAVGLRIAPATADESPWPMAPGSRMLAETAARCRDTGVTVLDTETIRLTPRTDLAAAEAVIQAAAELNARHLTTIAEDPDLARLSERFAELTRIAAPYGVRPLIEFMAYKTVRTLDDAVSIAARSGGGGVLLDALHIQRCGAGIGQIARMDPALLGYVQLCDARLDPPGEAGLPRDQVLPRGQTPDGGAAALEARAGRLLPGEGALPLAELLSVLPAAIPIAVEAPRLSLRGQLTPAQFAGRARRSLDQVLAQWRDASAARQGRDVNAARDQNASD
ncbi:MAG TPA: sugar phosphate isomerase/epimerase [Streptosporangiaceae bacterium]|nr:sugar phosphate isomerase/epimerase [Streptosporangiaceae bacterium]